MRDQKVSVIIEIKSDQAQQGAQQVSSALDSIGEAATAAGARSENALDEIASAAQGGAQATERMKARLAELKALVADNVKQVAAYDVELAVNRMEINAVSAALARASTEYGANSTEVKELEDKLTGLREAEKGLKLSKAVVAAETRKLSAEIKQLKDRASDAVSGFQQFESGVRNFMQNPLGAAQQAIARLTDRLGPTATGLLALGTAAGLAMRQVIHLGGQFNQQVDDLLDLSDGLGLSRENVLLFDIAAKRAGTTLQAMSQGVRLIADAIRGADPEAQKLQSRLAELGVLGATVDSTLLLLGQKLAEIQDPTQRAAIASELLGRGFGRLGTALVDLATNGEQLRGMLGPLGSNIGELAERAARWERAQTQLQLTVLRFQAALAGPATAIVEFLAHNQNLIPTLAAAGFALIGLIGIWKLYTIATAAATAATGAFHISTGGLLLIVGAIVAAVGGGTLAYLKYKDAVDAAHLAQTQLNQSYHDGIRSIAQYPQQIVALSQQIQQLAEKRRLDAIETEKLNRIRERLKEITGGQLALSEAEARQSGRAIQAAQAIIRAKIEETNQRLKLAEAALQEARAKAIADRAAQFEETRRRERLSPLAAEASRRLIEARGPATSPTVNRAAEEVAALRQELEQATQAQQQLNALQHAARAGASGSNRLTEAQKKLLQEITTLRVREIELQGQLNRGEGDRLLLLHNIHQAQLAQIDAQIRGAKSADERFRLEQQRAELLARQEVERRASAQDRLKQEAQIDRDLAQKVHDARIALINDQHRQRLANIEEEIKQERQALIEKGALTAEREQQLAELKHLRLQREIQDRQAAMREQLKSIENFTQQQEEIGLDEIERANRRYQRDVINFLLSEEQKALVLAQSEQEREQIRQRFEAARIAAARAHTAEIIRLEKQQTEERLRQAQERYDNERIFLGLTRAELRGMFEDAIVRARSFKEFLNGLWESILNDLKRRFATTIADLIFGPRPGATAQGPAGGGVQNQGGIFGILVQIFGGIFGGIPGPGGTPPFNPSGFAAAAPGAAPPAPGPPAGPQTFPSPTAPLGLPGGGDLGVISASVSNITALVETGNLTRENLVTITQQIEAKIDLTTIGSRLDQINQTLTSQLDALTSTVRAKLDELNRALSDRLDRLIQICEGIGARLEQLVTGGGGGGQNLISQLFGSFFGGGGGGIGNLFSGLFGGGGLGSVFARLFLPEPLINFGFPGGAQQSATLGGVAGGGIFGGREGALAGILGRLRIGGLLGGGLGGMLGSLLGGRGIGRAVGGAGGAILGSLIAFGVKAGMAGGIGALAGISTALLANPITAIIGAALLALGPILGRFARRAKEKKMASASVEEMFAKLRELISEVMTDQQDGPAAIVNANQLWDQWVAYLYRNLKDQTVIRRSIESQRPFFEGHLTWLRQEAARQQQRRRNAGLIPEFAQGGIVPGVDRGIDDVEALLRPGEFVLKRDVHQRVGTAFLRFLNEQPAQVAALLQAMGARYREASGDELQAMLVSLLRLAAPAANDRRPAPAFQRGGAVTRPDLRPADIGDFDFPADVIKRLGLETLQYLQPDQFRPERIPLVIERLRAVENLLQPPRAPSAPRFPSFSATSALSAVDQTNPQKVALISKFLRRAARFQTGGRIDSRWQLALLEPGEIYFPPRAAAALGLGALQQLNAGSSAPDRFDPERFAALQRALAQSAVVPGVSRGADDFPALVESGGFVLRRRAAENLLGQQPPWAPSAPRFPSFSATSALSAVDQTNPQKVALINKFLRRAARFQGGGPTGGGGGALGGLPPELILLFLLFSQDGLTPEELAIILNVLQGGTAPFTDQLKALLLQQLQPILARLPETARTQIIAAVNAANSFADLQKVISALFANSDFIRSLIEESLLASLPDGPIKTALSGALGAILPDLLAGGNIKDLFKDPAFLTKLIVGAVAGLDINPVLKALLPIILPALLAKKSLKDIVSDPKLIQPILQALLPGLLQRNPIFAQLTPEQQTALIGGIVAPATGLITGLATGNVASSDISQLALLLTPLLPSNLQPLGILAGLFAPNIANIIRRRHGLEPEEPAPLIQRLLPFLPLLLGVLPGARNGGNNANALNFLTGYLALQAALGTRAQPGAGGHSLDQAGLPLDIDDGAAGGGGVFSQITPPAFTQPSVAPSAVAPVIAPAGIAGGGSGGSRGSAGGRQVNQFFLIIGDAELAAVAEKVPIGGAVRREVRATLIRGI